MKKTKNKIRCEKQNLTFSFCYYVLAFKLVGSEPVQVDTITEPRNQNDETKDSSFLSNSIIIYFGVGVVLLVVVSACCCFYHYLYTTHAY